MININFNISENEWNGIINYILADLTEEEREIARKTINKIIDKCVKDLESLKVTEPIKPLDFPKVTRVQPVQPSEDEDDSRFDE